MPKPARAPALLLILAGCAPLGPADPPRPLTVRFGCVAGGPLTITYERDRARLVDADGRIVELDQRPAGSGILYEGAAGSLRGKGEEITWTPIAGQPRTCTAIRQAVPVT